MNKSSIKEKSFLASLILLSAVIIVPTSWAHGNCTRYTAVLHLEGASHLDHLMAAAFTISGINLRSLLRLL